MRAAPAARLRLLLVSLTPLLMAPSLCGYTGPVETCPAKPWPEGGPGGAAIAPDGARAFVVATFGGASSACNGSRRIYPAVYVVDLAGLRTVATIDLPGRIGRGLPAAQQVEIVGDEVVVLSPDLQGDEPAYATLPVAGPWTTPTLVKTSAYPLAMASAAGRAFLLLRDGAEVVVHTPGQPDRSIALPGGHRTAAIRAAHGVVAVATESEVHEIDPTTLALVRTIPLPGCHPYPDTVGALAPVGPALAVVCREGGVALAGSGEAFPAPAGANLTAVDGSDGEPTGLVSLVEATGSSLRAVTAGGLGPATWRGAVGGRVVFLGDGYAYAALDSGVTRLSLAGGAATAVPDDNGNLAPRGLAAPRGGSPLLLLRQAESHLAPAVEVLAVDPPTAAVLGAPLLLGPPPAYLAGEPRP